jgi:hypothetical protein
MKRGDVTRLNVAELDVRFILKNELRNMKHLSILAGPAKIGTVCLSHARHVLISVLRLLCACDGISILLYAAYYYNC